MKKRILKFMILNLQLFASPNEDGVPEPSKTDETPSTDEYIENIRRLKENSVSKEEYEKVLKEKSQLAKALIDSQPGEPSKREEGSPSIDDLRKKLFTGDIGSMPNLEFAKNALELRQKLMAEGAIDPFLPQGAKATYSASDAEAAQRVADVLQECVDRADGDSGAFTALFMSRLDDVPMPKNRRN